MLGKHLARNSTERIGRLQSRQEVWYHSIQGDTGDDSEFQCDP